GQAMADRFTYIPLIGVFMAVAWLVPELLASRPLRKTVLIAVNAVLVPVLMLATWFQVLYWRDSEALFRRALDVTSNNAVAHTNLGLALADRGRLDEAEEHFEAALEARPRHALALFNLGTVYMRQGRLDEAVATLSKSIELAPYLVRAHTNLGMALTEQGEYERAAESFLKALEIRPQHLTALYNLAVVRMRQGRLDEAAEGLEQVLAINPNWPDARAVLDELRAGRYAPQAVMKSEDEDGE
ncbi:MAG: DUF3808 domain-containing protein, partial [Candidatus Hydrogenedentes bacterium]|nr:DUF3808 domain-containing protein [Candidatus Hydrogenedentota bacterium]